MKKTIFSCFVLAIALVMSNAVRAQQPTETETGVAIDTDVKLMRKDLRAEKKQIIALNVPLTPDEATKFWPVYDDYANAMMKVNDEFYSLISDYAANQKTLTDAQAVDMVKKWSDLQ